MANLKKATMMESMGKMLIGAGILFLVAGALFLLFGKIPFAGKLPGDLSYKSKNFSIYFPIATSLLVSLVLSAIMYIIRRFF